MVSASDRAKRVLVSLLRTLAATYGVVLQLSRDSSDVDVRSAFKKVSRKAHPDQGGSVADQTALNTARDNWQDAVKEAAGKKSGARARTGSAHTAATTTTVTATRPNQRQEFRVCAVGVLLTYQKFPDLAVWSRFLAFVAALVKEQKVKFWCATLETNLDETYHLHLMLQFYTPKDGALADFAFEGVRPNARTNDLLGEGCLQDGLGNWASEFRSCCVCCFVSAGFLLWPHGGQKTPKGSRGRGALVLTRRTGTTNAENHNKLEQTSQTRTQKKAGSQQGWRGVGGLTRRKKQPDQGDQAQAETGTSQEEENRNT